MFYNTLLLCVIAEKRQIKKFYEKADDPLNIRTIVYKYYTWGIMNDLGYFLPSNIFYYVCHCIVMTSSAVRGKKITRSLL